MYKGSVRLSQKEKVGPNNVAENAGDNIKTSNEIIIQYFIDIHASSRASSQAQN
jgi:hypothetical protein